MCLVCGRHVNVSMRCQGAPKMSGRADLQELQEGQVKFPVSHFQGLQFPCRWLPHALHHITDCYGCPSSGHRNERRLCVRLGCPAWTVDKQQSVHHSSHREVGVLRQHVGMTGGQGAHALEDEPQLVHIAVSREQRVPCVHFHCQAPCHQPHILNMLHPHLQLFNH